jgi:hypothetical protein
MRQIDHFIVGPGDVPLWMSGVAIACGNAFIATVNHFLGRKGARRGSIPGGRSPCQLSRPWSARLVEASVAIPKRHD